MNLTVSQLSLLRELVSYGFVSCRNINPFVVELLRFLGLIGITEYETIIQTAEAVRFMSDQHIT